MSNDLILSIVFLVLIFLGTLSMVAGTAEATEPETIDGEVIEDEP
jgi:hypothetical protein